MTMGMKYLLKFILILPIIFSCINGYAYEKKMNPFTKKLDYVGMDEVGDLNIECVSGKILKSSGSGVWTCQDDQTAVGGSGNDVVVSADGVTVSSSSTDTLYIDYTTGFNVIQNSSTSATVSSDLATTSSLGIASFDSNHVEVVDGRVSLKADGIDDTLIDWGTGANQVEASDMPVAVLGSPTYDQLQEAINSLASSGLISGGVVSDSGSGEVDVASGTGWIKATDSNVAEIMFFDWGAETNVDTTDDATSYIGIEYNDGTPQVVLKSSSYSLRS